MPTRQVTWPLASNVIRGKSERNAFGMVRAFANGRPKPHRGGDFSASIGTSIYAIADGKNEFIRNNGGYDGPQLCLSFKCNGIAYYAFSADPKATSVAVGAAVKLGDCIATSGNSSNAKNLPGTEDHLHFEVRTSPTPGTEFAGRVSPLKVFGQCPLKVSVVR